MPPYPLTSFEIQKYYENEPKLMMFMQKYYRNERKFNGVYSRNNSSKLKDGGVYHKSWWVLINRNSLDCFVC